MRSQSEEPRAAAREPTVSAEGGLAARTRWLIAGLIVAALVPSLILGALWLGLVSTSWSTPAASPSEPQSVAPSAVLTAPDRIEAIAGEDVSFPIALDGTDGVPSRSVIAVRGLPQGSNFSEGRPYGDSEWSLKPDQIGDLDLVLPASANGEFKLGIALIAPDDKVVAEAETLLEIAPAPAAADLAATEAGGGPEPEVSEATATGGIPTEVKQRRRLLLRTQDVARAPRRTRSPQPLRRRRVPPVVPRPPRSSQPKRPRVG